MDWTRQHCPAHTTSDALNHRRTQLADTHAALSPLVVAAGELAATARQQLHTITEGWDADQRALAPIAGTPAGRAALLRAGAHRVAEATTLITSTMQAYTQLDAHVAALTDQLPTAAPAAGQRAQKPQ